MMIQAISGHKPQALASCPSGNCSAPQVGSPKSFEKQQANQPAFKGVERAIALILAIFALGAAWASHGN